MSVQPTHDDRPHRPESGRVGRVVRIQPRDASPSEQQFIERFPQLLPIAYTASYRILGDAVRSEDVAQEALVRAMTRWEQIESYAEPWISRVATNLAIDEWRRSRGRAIEPIDTEMEGDDDATRVVQRDELRRALASLPQRQREAIVLRLIEGYTPDETAAAMGIAPSGALKHTTRALRALRLSLGSTIPSDLPEDHRA